MKNVISDAARVLHIDERQVFHNAANFSEVQNPRLTADRNYERYEAGGSIPGYVYRYASSMLSEKAR